VSFDGQAATGRKCRLARFARSDAVFTGQFKQAPMLGDEIKWPTLQRNRHSQLAQMLYAWRRGNFDSSRALQKETSQSLD
jgi:hypothetical protein